MTTQVIHDPQAFEWLTVRGWRLLPCHPRSKEPLGKLVPHGVKDATTDRELIGHWLRQCPDANMAVACGAPGPQVVDIDRPELVPPSLYAVFRSAPRVMTGRPGWHLYFEGTGRGTVKLPFGECRGVGSYVLIPPSIHPSGKPYEWRQSPRGPLPKLPGLPTPTGSTKRGCGEQAPATTRVPYGHRHDHLVDFAVRLVRAGVLDAHRMTVHLQCEFDHFCDPLPAPEPGSIAKLARDAVTWRIAERERRNGR